MNARLMLHVCLVTLLGVALLAPRTMLPCCAATRVVSGGSAAGDFCGCCEATSQRQDSDGTRKTSGEKSSPRDEDDSHTCADCSASCCVKTSLPMRAPNACFPEATTSRLVILTEAIPERPAGDGVFHPPRLL